MAVVKVIVVGTVTEDVVLDAKLTSASKGGWWVSTTEIFAVLPSLIVEAPVTEMASTSSSMAVTIWVAVKRPVPLAVTVTLSGITFTSCTPVSIMS